MATVNDIYAFLNDLAPVRYQMDFDNAGFLVGDGSTAVERVLLALDITNEVIAEAAALHAQLIGFAPSAHLHTTAPRDGGRSHRSQSACARAARHCSRLYAYKSGYC